MNRAVVEVAKLVAASRLPLELVGVQGGFQRDDGRSWLGFHDGVNNMPSSQRRIAIEAATADPAWMQGGTYMAILRVLVDLTAWHDLTRDQQELLVGRHKLTGCPLTSTRPGFFPPERTSPIGVHPTGSGLRCGNVATSAWSSPPVSTHASGSTPSADPTCCSGPTGSRQAR